MTNLQADLTDAEIERACQGLVQNAAKVRHLKRMGLVVRTKPNGEPLVNRNHYDAVTGSEKVTGNKAATTLGEPNWSVPA